MSRLTLRLPETLHQQLAHLAEGEGISLNQYIVYALTRQVTLAYAVTSISDEEVQQQKRLFDSLVQELEKSSSSDTVAALAEREMVNSEKELDSDTVERLQQKIKAAARANTGENACQ